MTREFWSFGAPVLTTALTLALVFSLEVRETIQWGVFLGLGIALFESIISVSALKWAWQRKQFYWIWGGGILVRLLVLVGTAFVVYQYTPLSLPATLLSLVVATTLFLVWESGLLFHKT